MKKEYFGAAVDIWACGVLLYAILCACLPFRGSDDRALFKDIQKCDLRFPTTISSPAKLLIQKMLKVNHAERPTAHQVSKKQARTYLSNRIERELKHCLVT